MAAADTSNEQDDREAPSTRDAHVCACHADQELLGRALADHADPHVRIIAHMSNRQLAMAEQIGDLTRGIFRVAGGVSRLEEKLADARGEIRDVSAGLSSLTTAITELTAAVKELSAAQATLSTRLGAVEEKLAQGPSAQTV